MTYLVTVCTQIGQGDPLFPDGRMIEIDKKFPSLHRATAFADKRIEEIFQAGSFIEVRERKGPAKYRVERDQLGFVKKIALV